MKYEQENNRTYAVIENEYETQDCEYEQKMLQKNTIAGLLKMQTRRINNKIMFFYDVTSRQTLDKIFSYKNLGWQDFVNVINGIENMARSVDDYMLGIDSVIISPETIFYDAAGTNIEFIYFNCACIYKEMGEFKIAKVYLIKLLKINPNYPNAKEELLKLT